MQSYYTFENSILQGCGLHYTYKETIVYKRGTWRERERERDREKLREMKGKKYRPPLYHKSWRTIRELNSL